MPKKTKKQKLLAELHRKISAISTPHREVVNTQIKTPEKLNKLPLTSVYSFKNRLVAITKTSDLALDYSHVKHDLIRILVFTLIALIFQSVLYFFLRTR